MNDATKEIPLLDLGEPMFIPIVEVDFDSLVSTPTEPKCRNFTDWDFVGVDPSIS